MLPSPPIHQNGHIFPSSHPIDHSPASSASHGSCSPAMPSWLLSPTPEFPFNLTSFRQPSKIGPAFPFTPLPWEGVLCTTCPAWHRLTLGCRGRRGKPTSSDHDSPGLRLPLHQPPVPPPLGVGAEMVCQLPAKLLHGTQCITFLQRQPQVTGWVGSLCHWSRVRWTQAPTSSFLP